MNKIQNKEEYHYNDDEWRITYFIIDGKGIVRFDFGSNYRLWQEKDFLEHIKKLKGLNQKQK